MVSNDNEHYEERWLYILAYQIMLIPPQLQLLTTEVVLTAEVVQLLRWCIPGISSQNE